MVYQNIPLLQIGMMNIKCTHCGAFLFEGESKGMCCSNGKVKLEDFHQPPQYLKQLLDKKDTHSNHFMTNIRRYNNAFSFTSFGTSVKTQAITGFRPVFKIQGKVYHLIGSLLPNENESPKFAQIYFLDDKNERIDLRRSSNNILKPEVLHKLDAMLGRHNSYAKSFKYAIKDLDSDSLKIVINANVASRVHHPRTINAPICSEVAAIVCDQEGYCRDIVISKKDNSLQRIVETHRSYDALQYPLIHPFGQNGYSIDIPQVNEHGKKSMKTVSCKQFYSFRLMTRDNNYLLKYGNLLNQYLVDVYAKIESERLLYIRNNQTKLRVENYMHLKDSIQSDIPTNSIGKLIVLPSTFTGGPRYLHEYTQDAMTYVKHGGKPTLFITYTCNPKDEELLANLDDIPSYLRQEIIARIFHQKLLIFHNLIVKGQLFGEVKYYLYAVEWQKKGLPHMHILLWFYDQINPNDIDQIISAEIPSVTEDPELYDLIIRHMIHGPCGKYNKKCPCMKDNKCTKHFPKSFETNTQVGNDGYPKYKRRSKEQHGNIATINMKCYGTVSPFEIDNSWVVPYNPILLKIFKSHINVEWCKSVSSIKYILKYITKGPDYASFKLVNGEKENDETSNKNKIIDEISNYTTGRYINSNEAAWRIFGFETHKRYPPIQHLDIHLENNERVYFTEQNASTVIENPRPTTLTAFFNLCATDDFAKQILYGDVSKYYTFDKKNKQFKKRKNGTLIDPDNNIKESNNLSRMYTVNPRDRECYHLRLLLNNVLGPTSFQDLRTVDGIICHSYQEACLKLELIGDDKEWVDAMSESKLCDSPYKMRNLFTIILVFCEPSNPKDLWDEFWLSMGEDFLFQLNGNNCVNNDIEKEIIYEKTYNEINKNIFNTCGKNLTNYFIEPPKNSNKIEILSLLMQEKSYNLHSEKTYFEDHYKLLNEEQKNAFNTITEKCHKKSPGIVFIDAPGGTGKTFLLNLILSNERSKGHIALAAASSGVASTLLRNGKTAHRTFNLPLNLQENTTCDISPNSDTGKLLEACSIIIWDEAPMMHKNGFEALNRTLQDIKKDKSVMGGVLLILAGDFRQILPIVKGGTKYDEIKACLKNSFLWSYVKVLKLTQNMRIKLSNLNDTSFETQLLSIGNGTWPQNENEEILLDETICKKSETIQQLIATVFKDFENNYQNHKWVSERAILSLRNDSVDEINETILEKIPEELKFYKSIDSTVDECEATIYPTEFLNSLNHSGIPQHILKLKVGAIIMLMRNLNPPYLCNGTKLIIKSMRKYVIEGIIVNGQGFGETVLIPRIPCIPTDIPFKYKRHQLPVKLAYAKTFNKCQGQTLTITGIDLTENVFSHGQLYVAFSRTGNPDNQFVLTSSKFVKNIVYKEILTEELN